MINTEELLEQIETKDDKSYRKKLTKLLPAIFGIEVSRKIENVPWETTKTVLEEF